MMQRVVNIVVALAVLGTAGAYFMAPYFAFFALRSAAQAQDVQGLEQLTDYDAVRGSLRQQIGSSSEPHEAAPSMWRDPVGAFKHAIEPLQGSPKADEYVSPPAMAALTMGRGRDAPDAVHDAMHTEDIENGPWPRVRFWGLNRCRLAVVDDEHGETEFTFERRGPFTWKLVQIGLPPKGYRAPRHKKATKTSDKGYYEDEPQAAQ